MDFKIGFDSCTSTALINFSKKFNRTCIDFCEAARFSMYISADMRAMPCSFMNQQGELHVQLHDITGNVKGSTIQEAWDSEVFETVRTRLETRCMGCKDRTSCGGGCPALDRVALCDRRERYEDKTGSCYKQQQQ